MNSQRERERESNISIVSTSTSSNPLHGVSAVFSRSICSGSAAQGTIEYLLIIGIVVVISLVVVAMLVNQAGAGQKVSGSSNKLGSLSQSIGVIESLVSPVDGNFVLKLLNNSGGFVTVSNVKVGGTSVAFSEDLAQGGSRLFKVPNGTVCEQGKIMSEEVVITYVTENGLVKTMKYPAEVMFDCTPFTLNQVNLANQCPTLGFLHSGQARCWNTANTEVVCSSADSNTIYQDARKDGSVKSFTTVGVPSGTVKDNYTGLIWQQAGTSYTMTWYAALGYCAQLNLGGYSVGSWRLPSNVELMTFADYNCSAALAGLCTDKYININFTATGWDSAVYGYWSSTTVPSGTSYAYLLGSGDGGIYSSSKAGGSYYGARCVRSGN